MSSDRLRLVAAALVVGVVAVVAFLIIPEDEEEQEGLCDLGRDNRQDIIGHDVGVSIVLPDNNRFFLFGDTWIGDLDGDRQIESQTSNSAAILPRGDGICSNDLQHLINDDGSVRQLIPLRPGDDPETTAHWPVDSVIFEGQIVTYYRRVDRGESLNVLQFNVLGTGVATASLDTLQYTLAPGDLFTTNEHVAAAEFDLESGFVYVLICESGPVENDIFSPCKSARVQPQSMAQEDAYEFYSADGAWTTDIDQAVDVLDNSESEMTLHQFDLGGEARWVVTYVPPFTCNVVIRTAPQPWGPYTGEITVYEADAESRGGSRCYGGKLHPEFSSSDRLVVSWISSGTLEETLENPDTYWPHVVEVDAP